MRCVICTIAAATLAFCVIGSMATAQRGRSTQQAVPANPASNPDQELGRRFLIKAENLLPPKSDPVAASRSLVIPYAGQTPRVMEGFTATPFITGLEHPRRLLVLPNNDVIVAEQKTGHLTLLRDQDGDGKATTSNAMLTTSRRLMASPIGMALFSLRIRRASGVCRM
jgi:glucose/arabinose dehydrogenase